MQLSETQMLSVTGGLNLSGTLINAFGRSIIVLLDLGRSFGSSIRRVSGGKICPL